MASTAYYNNTPHNTITVTTTDSVLRMLSYARNTDTAHGVLCTYNARVVVYYFVRTPSVDRFHTVFLVPTSGDKLKRVMAHCDGL